MSKRRKRLPDPPTYRILSIQFEDGALEIPYVTLPTIIFLNTKMPADSETATYEGRPVRVLR